MHTHCGPQPRHKQEHAGQHLYRLPADTSDSRKATQSMPHSGQMRGNSEQRHALNDALEALRHALGIWLATKIGLEHRAVGDAEGGQDLAANARHLVDNLLFGGRNAERGVGVGSVQRLSA